jgi:hypothetical protein
MKYSPDERWWCDGSGLRAAVSWKPLPVLRFALMVVVGTLILAGCQLPGGSTDSSSQSPSAGAIPSPAPSAALANSVGAPTPFDAVTMLLPLAERESVAGPSACRHAAADQWSRVAGCPLTLRLQQRMQENPTIADGFDVICRCRDTGHITISVVAVRASTAQVEVTFRIANASTASTRIAFSAVHEVGGWVVDDTFCAIGPRNSIYDNPVRTCP